MRLKSTSARDETAVVMNSAASNPKSSLFMTIDVCGTIDIYHAFKRLNIGKKCSLQMVPATGLEPVRCYSLEPESSASANSATRAGNPTKSARGGSEQHSQHTVRAYYASVYARRKSK